MSVLSADLAFKSIRRTSLVALKYLVLQSTSAWSPALPVDAIRLHLLKELAIENRNILSYCFIK